MPPRRDSKRKVSDDDVEEAPKASTSKKQKVDSESGTVAPGFAANGQPNNKVIPENISFPAKPAGALRISAYNIWYVTRQRTNEACANALSVGLQWMGCFPQEGFEVLLRGRRC